MVPGSGSQLSNSWHHQQQMSPTIGMISFPAFSFRRCRRHHRYSSNSSNFRRVSVVAFNFNKRIIRATIILQILGLVRLIFQLFHHKWLTSQLIFLCRFDFLFEIFLRILRKLRKKFYQLPANFIKIFLIKYDGGVSKSNNFSRSYFSLTIIRNFIIKKLTKTFATWYDWVT